MKKRGLWRLPLVPVGVVLCLIGFWTVGQAVWAAPDAGKAAAQTGGEAGSGENQDKTEEAIEDIVERYLQENGYVNANQLQEILPDFTRVIGEELAAQDWTGQMAELENQQNGTKQELENRLGELKKQQDSMQYAATMSVIAVLLGVAATVYAQLSWGALRKYLRREKEVKGGFPGQGGAEQADFVGQESVAAQPPVSEDEIRGMVQEEVKRVFQYLPGQMVPILCKDRDMRAFVQGCVQGEEIQAFIRECVQKEWERMAEGHRQAEPKVEAYQFSVVEDKPVPKTAPSPKTATAPGKKASPAAAPQRKPEKYIVAGKDLTGNNELRVVERPGQLVIVLYSDNTVGIPEEPNRGKMNLGMNFLQLGLFDLFEVVADGSLCTSPADMDANGYYRFKETVRPARVSADGRKDTVRVLKKGRVEFATVPTS